jgi:hypothetical protein
MNSRGGHDVPGIGRSLAPTLCLWVACTVSLLPPEALAEPPDPLDALNAGFRKAYSQARADALANLGPVVLVDGDTLVLIRGKERSIALVIPARYHFLKAIAHAPLGVYLVLSAEDSKPLPEPRLDDLRRLRELTRAARKAVNRYGFSEGEKDRQGEILSGCTTFLDGVLERRRCDGKELTAFCRRMAPLVLANAADAAKLQIDAYHKQMSAWRKQMTAEQWRQLRVVVQGSQMPRNGHIAVQYFAKLLGEPGEGKRIIYAEALFDAQRALNLLGSHVLDGRAAAVFFDDPRRLNRDLLSDAAAEYLKRNPVQ